MGARRTSWRRSGRHHEAIDDTAGFRAQAGCLSDVLEEAASALAEGLSEGAPVGGAIELDQGIDLVAASPEALARAWLDTLAELATDSGAAICSAQVRNLEAPDEDGEDPAAWRVRGRAWLWPYGTGTRPRPGAVPPARLWLFTTPGGWHLTARA